jgi:branched-chain amino acid transport system ATP-binding protein
MMSHPGAARTEPLLSVRKLHSGYGRIPILKGISFDLAKDEFVSILGHNGMGKTTLLRTLMGYLRGTAGNIILNGQDITGYSTTTRARSGLGYVPQGREIFSHLSVYENLRVGCLLNSANEKSTIDEILTLFPRLRSYLDRPGGALSGGEQQLLALARCLCGAPDILLLDEPTEGIQPSIIAEMIETLMSIQQARKLTVLLVEQNLDFITALSQRVLILKKGRIVYEISTRTTGERSMIRDFVSLA